MSRLIGVPLRTPIDVVQIANRCTGEREMAVAAAKPEEDTQFRIETTGSFREPRTRILKHGNTFAVLDSFGDMAGSNGNPDGLYHEDTRFLSRLELTRTAARPARLSSNPAADNTIL